MDKLLLIALVFSILLSCSDKSERGIQSNSNVQFSDTLQFSDLGLAVLFSDNELFDTSYQLFEYDMCTPVHNSAYRISNSDYYNEDTLIFLYNYRQDSLLNLTIYRDKRVDWITSTEEYLKYLYDQRRGAMKATGQEFIEPEIYHSFYKKGLEIGLIGSISSQKNGKSYTSLSVVGIVDSTEIYGHFAYLGSSGKNYLTSFEQIAKSIEIIKL